MLNKEVTAAFGNVKALVWTFSSVIGESDQPATSKFPISFVCREESEGKADGFTATALPPNVVPVSSGPTLHGVKLDVILTPTSTRSFSVDPIYRTKNHARMAAAMAALKAGIVDEVKAAKRDNPTGFGAQALKKEKKPQTPTPKAGSVAYEDLAEMEKCDAEFATSDVRR